MPEISSYTPGTFCWPELATTDQKSAVQFYSSLFGWQVNDQPIGPGETYSMFQLRNKPVGAAFTLRAEQRQQGVPPHWGSYVSVANAEDTVKRAKELGATVLAPPFDVMDAGRMAVLRDPTGAVFMVWQPKKHQGAAILQEPGTLCWTELATRDTKAAERFYTQLFGWKSKTGSDAGMEYTEFSVQGPGGQAVPGAGMMAMTPQMGSAPPNWMPYFAVTDCDATTTKAKQLGGNTYVPPTDIPNVGRFSVLADPQGAVFAVIKVVPR
jgi:predicted enzyme related to lactoylglutathione lyase